MKKVDSTKFLGEIKKINIRFNFSVIELFINRKVEKNVCQSV